MTRPDPTPDEARTTCPTCGAAVVVETSDEGTSFYRPDEARRETERFFGLLRAHAYDIDAKKNRVPKGTRRVGTLWVTASGEVVVEGVPNELPDDDPLAHNCDAMGCGSLGHIIARLRSAPAAEVVGRTAGYVVVRESDGRVFTAPHDGWFTTADLASEAVAQWSALNGLRYTVRPVGPSLTTEREEGT